MGLGNPYLLDVGDGGGEGGKAMAMALSCSICLEAVMDDGDRSWAKLQCGHQFHLDLVVELQAPLPLHLTLVLLRDFVTVRRPFKHIFHNPTDIPMARTPLVSTGRRSSSRRGLAQLVPLNSSSDQSSGFSVFSSNSSGRT